MSSANASNRANPAPRQRLSREERYRQLIDTAWQLVRDEGTEGLTLGRLAERSAIAKPVVYDHFPTRADLLAALYHEFDTRQLALMDAAFAHCEATLPASARAIASSFVGCVLAQGREIPGVIAALASTPELAKVRRACEVQFMEKCRAVLAPFASGGGISAPAMRGMIGAAEALSSAAASGELSAGQAEDELRDMIMAMVERS